MTRAASIFATIGLTAALVGCSGAPRLHQEIALKALVHDAYKHEGRAPGSPVYGRHFERGWKQAYYNLSTGADACPPSMPPETYWSVKYQSPEGCRKIAAWYEGYRWGTIAAERDLRPEFANVPLATLCVRPAATACREVSELRSEASADEVHQQMAEEAEEAEEADTALIPSRLRTDANVNLSAYSAYIPQESDRSPLISTIASGQITRLPPVKSTLHTSN